MFGELGRRIGELIFGRGTRPSEGTGLEEAELPSMTERERLKTLSDEQLMEAHRFALRRHEAVDFGITLPGGCGMFGDCFYFFPATLAEANLKRLMEIEGVMRERGLATSQNDAPRKD